MKLHHLNCGTLYPYITPWLLGRGNWRNRPPLVTHCLLIETSAGLMLVDTGFGIGDYTRPSPLVRMFKAYSSYKNDIHETAYHQIRNLGYDPADVRQIAITHMHLDHVGGLPDFPQAQIHIVEAEYRAITQPHNIEERFICRQEHWAHGPNWMIHKCQGDSWFGFDCTPPVPFGEISFFFVPLAGHTRGHSAVVIQTPEGYWIHCGDSYVYHGDVHPEGPFYPPHFKKVLLFMGILEAFRNLGEHAPRLRKLLKEHGDQVRIFCSHDAYEFETFAHEMSS